MSSLDPENLTARPLLRPIAPRADVESPLAESPAQKLHIAGAPVPAPFLSIVTRTQGLRPDTLRDVFLCLSGQSCIDFEHVIVGHKLTDEGRQTVRALMDENPRWLRERSRFIAVDGGNRTTPLNVAFARARGQYVAVLDDDDIVFGHWVETFRSLAKGNEDRVLRCGTVYQRYDETETRYAMKSPSATGEFVHLYPSRFDFLSHLQENRTPLMALAFPRRAFSERGIAFDETLSTSEDWDYLMHTAAQCGVACSPETTGIYRHWNRRNSSQTDHSQNEWKKNQRRVREKLDSLDLLLPAGSARRLRELMDERDILARGIRLLDENGRKARYSAEVEEAIELARRVMDADTPEELDQLRSHLKNLYNSTWWRFSAPIRWASAMLGRGRFHQPDPAALTTAHLRMAISNVLDSTSWKVSHPFRLLHSRLLNGRR